MSDFCPYLYLQNVASLMATQIGADDFGSDALTNGSPASQLDQRAHNSTIYGDPNVISSPAGQYAIMATSSKSRLKSTRSSTRSRRGCYTCRKRLVVSRSLFQASIFFFNILLPSVVLLTSSEGKLNATKSIQYVETAIAYGLCVPMNLRLRPILSPG
jgi:hypothetical protein